MLKLFKPYGDVSIEAPLVRGIVEMTGVTEQGKENREKEIREKLRDADLLIGDIDLRITKELLRQAPKLRAVICRSIGVDYVDLKAASERNVLIVNSPDFCTIAVAEYALALLMGMAHRTWEASEAVRQGRWETRESLRGVELTGRTLGLIGYGRIGREVARRAIGLQMNVLAYDPYFPCGLTPDHLAQIVPLEQLLSASDAISVHVPLTVGTRGLIGPDELGRLKDGAIVINVSRGGIINEDALFAETEKGRLWAALDVLEEEPASDETLRRAVGNERLMLTPHAAWNTEEAAARNQEIFSRQIQALAGGILPPAVVNREIEHSWLQKWGGQ